MIAFIRMHREGKKGKNSYIVLVLSLSAHSNLIPKKQNTSMLKLLKPRRILVITSKYFRGWQVIDLAPAMIEENFIWKIQEA